jgi:hypothetical protein
MGQYKTLMISNGRFYSKSMKMIICFLTVVTFLQCKPGAGKNQAGEIVVIDVTKEYPTKVLYLQDIADVEYIPLGTNDNTLMRSSIARFHLSDNYIVTTNPFSTQGDFFVFDGKGKSKFSFNHRGQGPTEYNSIGSFAFDEKAKEIFIFDRFTTAPKILVYNENGKYKRSLMLFPELTDVNLYNYDDETLLVYDETGIFDMGVVDNKEYSHNPYLFVSKEDGSLIETLNTHLPVRLSDAVVWKGEKDGQEVIYSVSIPITNNRSFGKDFIIADWSSDTIYRLTPERKLQPIIVRIPSMPETDPKILLSNFLVTDKFILLGVYEMNYETLKNGGNLEARQLIYDFETGEINRYRFVNRDITTSTSVRMWEATTPGNTGVSMYDVPFLFGLDAKGELTGDLKELIKSLDEDDNPVLVKITFH